MLLLVSSPRPSKSESVHCCWIEWEHWPHLGSQGSECLHLGPEVQGWNSPDLSLPPFYLGDFPASVDIKDAYLHVPIFPLFQSFLGFALGLLHYQFVALNVGFSSALWVFTKVLVPVLDLLPSFGTPIVEQCISSCPDMRGLSGSWTFRNRCWNQIIIIYQDSLKLENLNFLMWKEHAGLSYVQD